MILFNEVYKYYTKYLFSWLMLQLMRFQFNFFFRYAKKSTTSDLDSNGDITHKNVVLETTSTENSTIMSFWNESTVQNSFHTREKASNQKQKGCDQID